MAPAEESDPTSSSKMHATLKNADTKKLVIGEEGCLREKIGQL